MSDVFNQTVNLKDKLEKEKEKILQKSVRPVKPASSVTPVTPNTAAAEKKAKAIDKVFRDDEADKPDFRKISRPEPSNANQAVFRQIIIILLIILIAGVPVWLYMRHNRNENLKQAETASIQPKWCAVALVTGEIYYGQITDIKANPVVLESVYYDYDQETKKETSTTDTGNIRLVKKGKESYGPSGKMMIYQAQIKSVDELAADSEVLKAIQAYEAKNDK